MLIIIMRLIHIISGVAWAGGAFMMAGFVEPAVRRTGADGGKVMQRMADPGKLPVYFAAASLLTFLSGLYLYDVHLRHTDSGWISSPAGIALTIGALAGLTATLHGAFATGPVAKKLSELGKEIAAGAGPPAPEQLAQLQSLQEKAKRHGRISSLLLLIAVGGMSLTGAV